MITVDKKIFVTPPEFAPLTVETLNYLKQMVNNVK